MDVTERASKFKRSLNLDLFLKHGAFFSQRSDIFFLLKLLFIKTERMCFKNVIAPTNREKKIITYFLIVHPRGTHAEISQTTKKICGENLPPILNQTNWDVEVSCLQEKFLKAEAELHRIKTKANKLDRMEGLLLHYEKLHGWENSNVQPLLLKIMQEKLRQLGESKTKWTEKGITYKEQTKTKKEKKSHKT